MVMDMLNELEVLKIAKGIEETGYHFYKQAAASFNDTSIKEVFEYLAQEELEHLKTFERIYSRVEEIMEPNESYAYDEEVTAYLRAIIDTAVFNVNGITNNGVAGAYGYREVLLMGLQAEKDSILFYEKILGNTKVDMTRKVLDRLIKEEVKHIHDLKRLLNNEL